jgi:N-acyl-L-homoserine lactone synthetase
MASTGTIMPVSPPERTAHTALARKGRNLAMIHVVSAENRRHYHHALMEMHRQRKAVFVDRMGWALDAPDGLEIDAYDTVDAIYLIEAAGPRAPVAGSVRLLPTDRPHLLGERFAHLCAGAPPSGPGVWEATRFCPSPQTPSGPPRRAMLARMIAAIMETALLFGVSRVTYVASAGLAPLALSAGWRVAPLAAPSGAGREAVQAFLAHIDATGLARVRAGLGARAPLIRFTPGAAAA